MGTGGCVCHFAFAFRTCASFPLPQPATLRSCRFAACMMMMLLLPCWCVHYYVGSDTRSREKKKACDPQDANQLVDPVFCSPLLPRIEMCCLELRAHITLTNYRYGPPSSEIPCGTNCTVRRPRKDGTVCTAIFYAASKYGEEFCMSALPVGPESQ